METERFRYVPLSYGTAFLTILHAAPVSVLSSHLWKLIYFLGNVNFIILFSSPIVKRFITFV